MLERTKQWNWPITRVFDLDYTDFQPEGTRRAILQIASVQSRTAIVYAQIKNSVVFSGGGVVTVIGYLADFEAITPISNLPAAFLQYELDFPVSDTHGCGGAIVPRELPSHPANECIILNHNQAAPIYFVLEVDAAHNINDLTAGACTVWFTYIRLR